MLLHDIPNRKLSLYTDFNYELPCLPDQDIGLMADMSGQQGVLTPPRHSSCRRPCSPYSLFCISYRIYEIDHCLLSSRSYYNNAILFGKTIFTNGTLFHCAV